MLWDAVHMAEAREGQVEGDGLRAPRLGVNMRLECLLPPPFWVALLNDQTTFYAPFCLPLTQPIGFSPDLCSWLMALPE